MTARKKMEAVDPHFAPTATGPKRDQWGRYLLPDPTTGEERAWTRVTTVSGLLSDRYNLEKWAQRMVAEGLAKRADLLALVKTARGNKKTLNRVVKDALEAGNTEQRANLGTAIHAAAEALDFGERVDIPAPYDRDVEAYGATMDELQLNVFENWVERIVIVPELGVAGTCDRLLLAPQWKLPRIGDLKTGSTVHFSELDHAIQLAMYANASHYWDDETGALVACPPIDKKSALIIHLPAGTGRCEVHDLDIAAGWEAAKLAVAVKAWRSRKELSKPYAA